MAAPADNPVEASSPNTIDAAPLGGQNISHDGQAYTTIKEGLAHILVPHGVPTSMDPRMSKEDTQKQQVFYNPIQQFNRDLSVLAIKTFGQDLVQRKTQHHEKVMKRNEKKKEKAQVKVPVEEQEGSGVAVELEANGDAPRKRKHEEDILNDEAVLSKKQKVDEDGSNGTEIPFPAGESENRPSHTNGVKRPWSPTFSILDALSATGLRALRYANEIPFATSITANDMSAKAVDSIALNVKHNKLEDKITAHKGNAIAYMYSYCDKKGYDVIDLDPYGTAAPFLDAAIQAVNDDGLLCVTCTDSAIFASHGYLEKTYSQYGGLPFKGEPCHEGGLRLILHAIASSAGRYGMSIEPLLSLSIDYYIRVFVRVRRAPNEVKLLAGKTMIVYHCESGCGAWTTQFLARNKETKNKKGDKFYKHGFAQAPAADSHCQHCGQKTHLSGPMYGGPLHNVGFIERVLAQLNDVDRTTYPTADRIEGMLHTALEEITFGAKQPKPNPDGTKTTQVLDPLIPQADPAQIDHHPFFFIPSSVAKIVHCSAPPTAAIRGALRHAGFRVTMSHCKPGSLKTDASWKDIWHIMLEWVRQRAPLKNPLKKESPGYAIMAKASAKGYIQSAPAAEGTSTTEKASEASSVENPHGEVKEEEMPDADAPSNSALATDPLVAAPAAKEGGRKVEEQAPSYLDMKYQVKFDEQLGRDHDRGKYVRYQLAPRENWGPMARAK